MKFDWFGKNKRVKKQTEQKEKDLKNHKEAFYDQQGYVNERFWTKEHDNGIIEIIDLYIENNFNFVRKSWYTI